MIGKKIQRTGDDWSDDELPEIDYNLDVYARKSGEKKKEAQGDWSDDELPSIDYSYNVGHSSRKSGPRHTQPAQRTSGASSASRNSAAPRASTHTTIHRCSRSGHIFRHERISLRQDQRVGQHTRFDLEGMERCEECCMVIVENLWVCEIPTCGRRACGMCKRGLDAERARRARESWRR